MSQLENHQTGRQQILYFTVESLVQFYGGDVEEGQDRSHWVEAVLALPMEQFAQLLSQLPQMSTEEIFDRLSG